MDCSSPFGASGPLETLFSSTGIHHDDHSHMSTLEILTNVFYVLGSDLTPETEAYKFTLVYLVKEMCVWNTNFKTTP